MTEVPSKILLIDDDPDDYFLVKDMLSDILTVEWMPTYEKGLEAVCSGGYGACLLDYRLGARDGVELIREATQRGCDTAIIILTGHGDYRIDIEAMRAGAADYLQKDLLSRDLLERSIRYSIERKRTEKALRKARDELEIRVRERTFDLEAANRALAESEQRYRMLVDSALDIIYTISTSGRILGINPAFEAVTGWSAREWVGKSFRSLIHPDDLAEVVGKGNLLLDGEILPSAEVRILAKSGEYRVLECRSTPLRTGKMTAVIGTARDITIRKRMEEALRAAHSQLEIRVEERTAELARANESLRLEIIERKRIEEALRLDEMRLETLWELSQMSGGSEDEIARFVLNELVNITGSRFGFLGIMKEAEKPLANYAFPGILTEECAIVVHQGELAANGRKLLAEAAKNIRPGVINDYRALHGSKEYPSGAVPLQRVMHVPIHDGARVVAVAVVADKEVDYGESDIKQMTLLLDGMWKLIQRQRGEKALRDAENLLRLMADSLPAQISYIDTDQRYRFVNRGYQVRYGIPPEKMLGLKVEEVLSPDTYEAARSHIDKALAGSHSQFEMEAVYVGEKHYLSVSYIPNFDCRGQVIGIFAMIHDFTSRKRSELEAQHRRDELAHVSRVATMGELASSLAHELGQPLTGILSNAQAACRFLEGEDQDLEEVRAALEDIVGDSVRAGGVIKRLRSILKKKAFEPTSIDVNALVTDTLDLLMSDALRKKISVEADLSSGLPSIAGDRIQLQQVLINLILNGFDAMTKSENPSRRMVVRTSFSDGDRIVVAVRDSGPGVDSENLTCIFDPFFTTKSEGMGMGLPISRYIIEAHGGTLWAERNDDCGMSFCFSLSAGESVNQ